MKIWKIWKTSDIISQKNSTISDVLQKDYHSLSLYALLVLLLLLTLEVIIYEVSFIELQTAQNCKV